MLFRADAHAGLADGSITMAFRTWRRPQAKVGGRYRAGPVTIEVTAVDRVPVGSITAPEARAAGAGGRDDLVGRLGAPPGGLVYRVCFRRVPTEPDPRAMLAADADLTDADIAAIEGRLDRLDRAGGRDAWTRAVLELIARRPGVVSTELAESAGRDRASFKADVRKLKAMGLTESLEVGYRLSLRGEALCAAWRRRGQEPA